jgi:hypothetical protein
MPARAFIRHKRGANPEGAARFSPLPIGHAFYNERCPVCGQKLGDGKPVRLRASSDLSHLDPEEAAKYKIGQWFRAPADVIHDACAQQRAAVDHGGTVILSADV